MGVPVGADLVAGLGDGGHLVRERLERVARDEPRGGYPGPLEELQQAGAADLAGEHPSLDIVGRVLAAVGAEPPGHGVNVDADAQVDLLGGTVQLSGSLRSCGLAGRRRRPSVQRQFGDGTWRRSGGIGAGATARRGWCWHQSRTFHAQRDFCQAWFGL